MDERRFERLEDKVDQIKSEVSEIKADMTINFSRFSNKLEIFASHIEGDNKIINHIEPLLDQLPELTQMIKDHKFKDELSKRRFARAKRVSVYIGLLASIVGMILTLQKLSII